MRESPQPGPGSSAEEGGPLRGVYTHSTDSSCRCSSAPGQGWQSWDASLLRHEGKHRGALEASTGDRQAWRRQGRVLGVDCPGRLAALPALQEPKLFTQAGTRANLQVQPNPHQSVWLFLLRGSGTSHRLCFSPCQHHTPETQTPQSPVLHPAPRVSGRGLGQYWFLPANFKDLQKGFISSPQERCSRHQEGQVFQGKDEEQGVLRGYSWPPESGAAGPPRQHTEESTGGALAS